MSWIALALLPPLFSSLSILIDEYLIQRHFQLNAILFIALSYIIALPASFALLAYHPEAMNIPLLSGIFIVVTGVVLAASLIFYALALQRDDATIVVALFQLTPLVVFFLGWLFLGETVTVIRLLGAGLIIIAALAIVWDFQTRRLKWATLAVVSLSTLGVAAHKILIRDLTFDYDWLAITIWGMLGPGLLSLVAVIVFRPWQRRVITLLKQAGGKITALYFIQSISDIVALILMIKVLSIAPTAGLVAAVEGVLPFYILILSFILAKNFPELRRNLKSSQAMVWRIGCFGLFSAGLFLISIG